MNYFQSFGARLGWSRFHVIDYVKTVIFLDRRWKKRCSTSTWIVWSTTGNYQLRIYSKNFKEFTITFSKITSKFGILFFFSKIKKAAVLGDISPIWIFFLILILQLVKLKKIKIQRIKSIMCIVQLCRIILAFQFFYQNA